MPRYEVLETPVETGSTKDQGRPGNGHLEWYDPTGRDMLLIWDVEEPLIQVAVAGEIVATATRPHWHTGEAVHTHIWSCYCQSIADDVWAMLREAGLTDG